MSLHPNANICCSPPDSKTSLAFEQRLEGRKPTENIRLLDPTAAVPVQSQILRHSELKEDTAVVSQQRKPATGYLVRSETIQGLTHQEDLSVKWFQNANNCEQGR